MITAICLVVLVVSAFLVVYPYLLYPALLRGFPPVPVRTAETEVPLRYALMFCAYNEERSLPETIANLRRIRSVWPELEILAYSDCSSDRTMALLAEASDVLTAVEGRERRGKPAGMRELVSRTQADIAIFMDANVLISPDTIRRFERYFADPGIGAVAGTLHYVNEGESDVAQVGGLYWRLEERIKRRESETGSTMGADGSLFAMRRAFYPHVEADLQDDFLASMEVLFHGLRCVSAPDILAYEKGAVASASEFRRKRRIACGAFSTHRHMRARLRALAAIDRFKYASHKVVRWFGAFFILTGVLAATGIAATLGLLAPFLLLVAAAVAALLVLRRLGVSPVVKVTEILAAMLATAIGVVESLAGAKYAFWNPVDR